MEDKDIVGREFTCFEFSSDRTLTYGEQSKFVGLTAVVDNLNSAYPEYASVTLINKEGRKRHPHYPTAMIREQLEAKQREEEEKSVDDLLIEMKQLISRI